MLRTTCVGVWGRHSRVIARRAHSPRDRGPGICPPPQQIFLESDVAKDEKNKAPGAAGEPPPELPVFPGQEEDVLFKAQMGVANLFYGYWKHGIAVVILILAGVYAYGTWENNVRDEQRVLQAEISKVSRTLQKGLEKHAEEPDMITAQAQEGARRFEQIGDGGTGAGKTFAYIQAAQAWAVAEDAEGALGAWKKAHEVGAKASLGMAAVSGYASALVDQDRTDDAVAVLEAYAASTTGYRSARARFEAARYLELAGQTDASLSLLEQLQQEQPDSVLSEDVAEAVTRIRSQG